MKTSEVGLVPGQQFDQASDRTDVQTEAPLRPQERAEFYDMMAASKDELSQLLAERSRRLTEKGTTADAIRDLNDEIASLAAGFADLAYSETYQSGLNKGLSPDECHTEAVKAADDVLKEHIGTLLGDMSDKRTATAHNRFVVPKKLRGLADSLVGEENRSLAEAFVGDAYKGLLSIWKSWEVPVGDEQLVTRLRQTDIWKHLEETTAGNTKRAKLGQLGLTAVVSVINSTEKLVRYDGARKRLGAKVLLGAGAGIVGGMFGSVAGAGAAGAVVSSLLTRSLIRAGVDHTLEKDATVGVRSNADRQRLEKTVDEMVAGAYSTDEILAYVDTETRKMIYANDVQFVGGIAIGIVGGLVGRNVASGLNWLGHQWFNANFGTPAHADTTTTPVTSGTGSAGHEAVNPTTQGTQGSGSAGKSVPTSGGSAGKGIPVTPGTGSAGHEAVNPTTQGTQGSGSAGKEVLTTHEVQEVASKEESIAAYITNHPDAIKISKGEGFYQTFRDLGISKKDLRCLLIDMEKDGTFEKFVHTRYGKEKVVYWDKASHEPYINMTKNHQMPREILEEILRHAEKKGYVTIPDVIHTKTVTVSTPPVGTGSGSAGHGTTATPPTTPGTGSAGHEAVNPTTQGSGSAGKSVPTSGGSAGKGIPVTPGTGSAGHGTVAASPIVDSKNSLVSDLGGYVSPTVDVHNPNVVSDLGGYVSPKVDIHNPLVSTDLGAGGGTPDKSLFTTAPNGTVTIDHNNDGKIDWTITPDNSRYLAAARQVSVGDTWHSKLTSFAQALGVTNPSEATTTTIVRTIGSDLAKINYIGTNTPIAVLDATYQSGYRLNTPTGSNQLPEKALRLILAKLKS